MPALVQTRTAIAFVTGLLVAVVAGCGGSGPSSPIPSGDSVTVETIELDAPRSAEQYVPTLDGPLRILSASPAGQLTGSRERQPVSVTFSRSMVALGENEPPPANAITLDPSVSGSLRWEGTQTLVFTPTTDLPPATRFTVHLSSDVSDRDGNTLSEPYTWSFQTRRPRLASSAPADGAQFADPDGAIRLVFSLPVDASRAKDFLETDVPLQSVRNANDSTLVLEPAGGLEAGRRYRITAQEGLPTRAHELGLGADETITFRVRPPLALTHIDQPGRHGEDLFYPDRGLRLEFSTPVTFEQLRTALSFEPSVNLLPGVEARDANQGTTHTIPATFDPETTYTLSIEGLSDAFGQSIGSVKRTFTTRSYEPRLHVDRGLMVIEADQHPVIRMEATNVSTVDLGMERLSADEIVPALPTYDQRTYYDFEEQITARPPVAASRTYDLPIERNSLATVPVSMDSMLTEGTGIVALRVIRPKLGDHYDTDVRSLAQITHLGVTGKFSPHENVIVVTTLNSATPVEGATVTIRDARNDVRWTGTTDDNGRVATPGWHELGIERTNEYSSPAQFAIVEHEGDVAFTSNRYDDGLEPYRFGLDYSWNPEPETRTGTVFTDRGLYQTGETVHLKGIVRRKAGGDWHSYRDSVYVRVQSPRNEEVVDRHLRPSEIGSFHFEWSIPSDASLGRYRVEVNAGPGDDYNNRIATGSFEVNAFRRASFAVNAETHLDRYVAGDFFEGRVSAHYLFGAGMAGQPVSYELERAPTSYEPPGYTGFRFAPIDHDGRRETLIRREGRLDSSSSVAAERVRLPGNPKGAPAQLTWRGTVTAPSRQQISDQTTATLHPGRFYVGLRPNTTFLDRSQDSTLSVDVVTVEPNGAPVAGKDVTVELVHLQWNSVREVGADGRLQWQSERTETVVRSAEITTEPGRISRLHMTVPSAGRYRIRAKSQDLRGNAIRSETYLYASGADYVAWRRDNDDRISVVPEKTEYAPGETARLMVQSPYETATALITVEREGILRSRVRTVTGSTPLIELPIRESYLPNVFVSVILLKGRTAPPKRGSDPGVPSFKIGYASLSVDPEQNHLRVKMTPDQETYRPGENVQVDLRLQNSEGVGVPGEIAFSAADAGVLNLVDYRLPDPFETFYGPRPLGVTTSQTLADLVEQRSYGQKAEDTGGGGTEQKASVRTDFRPSAHWAPAIQTDGDGEARVTFRLPESLTTFRFMATALTPNHKFGAATTDVVVTKPLVLKSALPRFARMGDRFEAGVLVTNRSDEAGTATVSASAQGLALQNDTLKTVRLEAGGTQEVRFDWSAPAAGEAELTFRGRLDGETDALTKGLPVQRPTTKQASATFASTQGTATEALRLPTDRISGLGAFDVTLSSTALVGLDGAIEHLFEYPYGCLEQRTSRIRPLLAGNAILNAFDLEAVDGENRSQLVTEWLGSLRTYWTGRGFSLWDGGDHENEYVTGYVLLALAEAKAAGYDVPPSLTDETIDAVARMVRNRSERPAYYSESVWRETRAFLLYSLARHGRILASELNWLADHPPATVAGQSHLLRTLLLTDQLQRPEVRRRLVQQLEQQIRVEASTAYLDAPDSDDFGWIFSSDVRSTAFGLTTLLEAMPSDEFRPLAERMIRFLMERRQNGHWASTQDNTAVVTAFAHYVEAYEQAPTDLAARVELAGRSILEDTFDGSTLKVASTRIAADAFPSGRTLPLGVTASGTGRLYYSMRLTTYTDAPQDARDQGLQVERRVQRLDRQGKAVGAPVRTGGGTLSLESGELVKVTIRVSSPTSRTYVVVDDALPAGLEPLNEDFATTSQGVVEEADTGSDRWWGSFTHTEMHDDRVVLFADHLRAGEHTYSYVARATTPGTFVHPSAEAEMMYNPETRGRTATGTVAVEPPSSTTAER